LCILCGVGDQFALIASSAGHAPIETAGAFDSWDQGWKGQGAVSAERLVLQRVEEEQGETRRAIVSFDIDNTIMSESIKRGLTHSKRFKQTSRLLQVALNLAEALSLSDI
jgi:hypothetical protein